MSVLNINTGQTAKSGLGDHEQPQIVFVPDQLYQTLKLTNEPMSTLVSLEQMLELVGPNGIASFVFANSLYNSQDDIFLKDERITGFSAHDLIDTYRDQLAAREDLREQYTHIVKQYDGMKITQPELPVAYLREQNENVDNDMENAVDATQYYVPEMFVVSERIYGVRLKAVTGMNNSDIKRALKHATVANVGLLGNSYDIRQIARFEIFKAYVALC